jgi:ATP-binding cassette subfamily C protein
VAATLAVVLGLRGLYTLLQIAQSKLFHSISKEITARIRKEVLSHLERVELREFELLGSGAVTSRLVSDVETLDGFLSGSVAKFFISVLMLAGVSVVLLLIHWQLALFILLLNPFVVLFSSKLARKVARLKKEQNRAIEAFSEALTETLELFEQIRAANKERLFFGKLFGLVESLRQKSVEYSYKSDAGMRLSFLIFVGGFELFRAAGILAVAYSSLSIGLMMAIFAYLWFMMTPIQDLINILYARRSAEAALERINALLALSTEPRYPHKKDPFKEAVGIEIEKLTFAYETEPVLRGVSLSVAPCSRTAIVGASGSGKSTLCKLMVGLYALQEGDIRYGGASIKEIGLDRVRRNVHLVLQFPRLFNDTLRLNLTLGEEISEERIWEALKMAQLADLVAKLPEGLETPVGKNGVRLSGGERQRVAIARMILQEPAVVILDEATSALDIKTERRLFGALEEFLSRRTTILVAHRASTIERADYIYFLENGQIGEAMSFEEYLKRFC